MAIQKKKSKVLDSLNASPEYSVGRISPFLSRLPSCRDFRDTISEIS